jgi:N-acetylglucosaminyldiphosphoundecaprenol N-acetyl-beta-D-mannosaminyltransferase
MKEAVSGLISAVRAGRRGYVCVTSVHGVIESQRDELLRTIHNRSLMTVPDGMPLVWMGRKCGAKRIGRVYGPDLMLALCQKTAEPLQSLKSLNVETERSSSLNEAEYDDFNDLNESNACFNEDSVRLNAGNGPFTHFLYGAAEETLRKLKTNLEARFPGIQIVGTFAPPFRPLTEEEELELRKKVAACKPDFFWVGLSTPKQEKFMASHDSRLLELGSSDNNLEASTLKPEPSASRYPLDCGILLGVGAAFDIHAGNHKDAPAWVKKSGFHWAFRLCKEPKRLWRRYFDIVPRFIALSCLQLSGIRKYPPAG